MRGIEKRSPKDDTEQWYQRECLLERVLSKSMFLHRPSKFPPDHYLRLIWGVGRSDDSYAPTFVIHHQHAMEPMFMEKFQAVL
jgi:hypothetical protein